ncbi:MAG: hypothetical protein Q8O22_08290 [Candidatus Omnitrophota bacterium]|nr:hypothetical protein [Candidatus Omnitrophota bacterium]
MNSKLKVILIIILIVAGIAGCYTYISQKDAVEVKQKKEREEAKEKQINEANYLFTKPYQPVELINRGILNQQFSLGNQQRYVGKNIYVERFKIEDISQVDTNILVKGYRYPLRICLTANSNQISKINNKARYDIVARVSNINKGSRYYFDYDDNCSKEVISISDNEWTICGVLLDTTEIKIDAE